VDTHSVDFARYESLVKSLEKKSRYFFGGGGDGEKSRPTYPDILLDAAFREFGTIPASHPVVTAPDPNRCKSLFTHRKCHSGVTPEYTGLSFLSHRFHVFNGVGLH